MRRWCATLVAVAATVLAGTAPTTITPAIPATPAGYSVSGVDVSSYQATIDWAAVAAGGARFAIAKATEGLTYVDPTFDANFVGARTAGLFAGAYHYGRPDVSGGAAQADYLLAHARYVTDGHVLAPMLDIEWPWQGSGAPYPCYGLTQPQMVAWIHSFVNEIKARTGVAAMIYTNSNWWTPCTGNDAGFGDNPLAISGYTSSPPKLPAGWSAFTFWQYADTGDLPGDQDVFNGDLPALAGLASGVPRRPPAPRDGLAWLQPGALFMFAGSRFGTTGQLPVAAPGWAGVGDYSRDGKEDLYWYRASDGTLQVLTSTGSTFASLGKVRGPGVGAPSWAGTGDFTGDGARDSIAWLQGNTLFLFSGTGLATRSQTVVSTPGWAGVGDGSHDGLDDLYWYDARDGTIRGLVSTGSSFAPIGVKRGPGVGAPTWAGVGDFTADGYRDSIAWLQGNTLFLFTGGALSTVSAIQIATPRWIGVGDYNNDGLADLICYYPDGTLRVLASTGTRFDDLGVVRGPGVGAPTWAGTGNFTGSPSTLSARADQAAATSPSASPSASSPSPFGSTSASPSGTPSASFPSPLDGSSAGPFGGSSAGPSASPSDGSSAGRAAGPDAGDGVGTVRAPAAGG